MISSQDGTEERRALALFLAPGRGRADWSSADTGSAGTGTSACGSGVAGASGSGPARQARPLRVPPRPTWRLARPGRKARHGASVSVDVTVSADDVACAAAVG